MCEDEKRKRLWLKFLNVKQYKRLQLFLLANESSYHLMLNASLQKQQKKYCYE